LCSLEPQDIHWGNVLWNHDDSRGFDTSAKPCIPFHSTFDCRYAFVDFGSSTRFDLDDPNHLVPAGTHPPSEYASPEQLREGEYDAFAADLYNVGSLLLDEFHRALDVWVATVRFVHYCLKTFSQTGEKRSGPGYEAMHGLYFLVVRIDA
jgi:hypothetical protein